MESNENILNFDNLLNYKIQQLPTFQKQEVLDFVNFLLSKAGHHQTRNLDKKTSFDWEGALKKKYKDISSVELQHKIWE